MKRNNDLGLLILRLAVGVLMILYGIHKLTNLDGVIGILESNGWPSFIAYGVWIGEFVAPLLIIIGYRTRLAAIIYVINCLFIVYLAHRPEVFAFNSHGGWAADEIGIYLFTSLALVFTGGGKIALSSRNKWD